MSTPNPPAWAVIGVLATPFFVVMLTLLLQRCTG